MDREPTSAFASPEERAAATARGPRDRISLRDYIVDVEIGAFQAERGATQRVQFNVVVELAHADEPIDDDVDRIVSYDTLTDAIAASLAEERLNLLETLAEQIARRVLSEPRARRIFVRIEKLDRGPFRLGVEIMREQGGAEGLTPVEVLAPPPAVVFVSNAAMADARFGGWLDQLESLGIPLILTVEASGIAAPQSAGRMAQRRIDLLAIEQNAWVLAGRDDRCLVVDSRTEFEYAAKTGQTTVWAPSKMVLDAVEPAPHDLGDPGQMLGWLATHMEAVARYALSDQAIDGAVHLPLVDDLPLGG
ncbi:dihydroneopterin aldolase [Alphaproteobacteria bacterium KMM 3653]|uniref:dihydroneopterin aldolase n=1 Tax=Harenicola maris TaxID=2841044 RepID=A0AAP2G9X5_9RHOB|nr:dihydroneopterin aldolase [Harenicola maris]